MSIQAGIWNVDEEPINRESLFRISKNIAEYGPDGETTFIDGSIGVVYRPLHTTSESRLEQQLYRSFDGVVITWDGRLDNRDELISQLLHVLKEDKTDVAIVAAAFDRWGTDCFARLVGDWGLSIWNPVEKNLILARHYIGVRTLFYCAKPNRIMWCSQLAPLALSAEQFRVR